MTTSKKIPWLSLLLNLTTYTTFGWLLSTLKIFPGLWIIVILVPFILSAILTSPFSNLEFIIVRWIRSDILTFFFISLSAFFAVLILNWIHVFADALVILCTTALVRLDFHVAGFNDKKSFWVLTCISLMGLGLGWLIHNFSLVLEFIQKIIK